MAKTDGPIDHSLQHTVEIERRLGDRLDDVPDRIFALFRKSELAPQLDDLLTRGVGFV